VTLLVTLIPYLIGASFTTENRHFLWLGYNIDDACVYLSWMRQAAEGSLRVYNRFTTEPQQGMLLNPLFLVMGNIARFTGMPLIGVYHAGRLLAGLGLLLIVWRFLGDITADPRARRASFLFVCFSAGLGWLPFLWNLPLHVVNGRPQGSIDTWQPEAVTFLSLYLNPLFVVSMAMQVTVLHHLLRACLNNSVREALIAGGIGFLLALIHTYDVLTLFAVWIGVLLFQWIRPLGSAKPSVWLKQTALAGLLTAPGVIYISLQLRSEAVFRARANVETLSAPIYWILIGYAPPLLLAGVAIFRKNAVESSGSQTIAPTYRRLLIVWLVMNILVSYTPGLPFQRKMLQGAHFPIAILAGIGFVTLFRSTFPGKESKLDYVSIAAALLLGITNIRFLFRDMNNYTENRTQTFQQRPYLQKGEMEAMNWIVQNTPRNALVQPLPWMTLVNDPATGRRLSAITDTSLACLTPGFTGRAVYCGHWGETPEYGVRLSEMKKILLPQTPDPERIALLKKMKAKYLLFTQKQEDDTTANELMPQFRGMLTLPQYLTPVFVNRDATVLEVNLPAP
jgi:hypothetical protein